MYQKRRPAFVRYLLFHMQIARKGSTIRFVDQGQCLTDLTSTIIIPIKES